MNGRPGEQGSVGQTGPRGDFGPTGPKGKQGVPGSPGKSAIGPRQSAKVNIKMNIPRLASQVTSVPLVYLGQRAIGDLTVNLDRRGWPGRWAGRDPEAYQEDLVTQEGRYILLTTF